GEVEGVARNVQRMVGPQTLVVPLQNGVDAPSQLAAILGPEHVLAGLCGTISWVVAPGRIRNIGAANFVKFGELDNRRSERAEKLRQLFEKAGVNVDIPSDIHKALWEKFLLVTAFGGVGAVSRGSDRNHAHRAGNAIVARTMHARGVRGSACEPCPIKRYSGRRHDEIH